MCGKTFFDFQSKNNFRRYSGFTSKGAVFAYNLCRTIRTLKNWYFTIQNAKWIVEINTVKNYKSTKHPLTELKPIQASFKKD